MKKIYILIMMLMLGILLGAQPIADFEADDRTPTLSQAVLFRNLSTGATSYEWTFTPNTVTFITGSAIHKSPKIKFNQAVNYTVQLKASNGSEDDFELKFEYIIISPFQIGINEDGASGYINIQVRVNEGDLPSASKLINDIEFGIMWDKSIINGNKIDLDLACADLNPYHIEQKGNPVPHNYGGNGGWDYRNFGIINGTGDFAPPETWEYGRWMTIVQLQVYSRTPGDHSPTGHFLIVPNKDHFNKAEDPIMEIDGYVNIIDTLPPSDIMGDVELPIPTNLHGYIWVGGRGSDGFDGYSWSHGPNWNNGCGGESNPAAVPPGIYDDCIIPNVDDASGCYPRYTRQTNPTELIAVGQDISVVDGGRVEWMYGLNSTEKVLLQTQGYLNIDIGSDVSVYEDGLLEIGGDSVGWIAPLKILGSGGLQIKDQGFVNAKYRTTIKANEGLIIESNLNGTGSFINTGKVLYENGGTAKVQTYISGFANVYHMHLAGPTVKDVSYTNLTGVRLEQFNMTTLDTYAYEWRPDVDINIEEPEPHVYYGWENVWPFEYNVKVANGLAITNWEAGSGTMDMIGFLNADTANAIQYQVFCAPPSIDNQLELISNPFSAAISFDNFYEHGDNGDYILGKYKIWDEEIGNYGDYVVGLYNANEYIQVGQGFFVETTSSGTLEFTTEMRNHSDVAFRELNIDNLTLGMDVTGENSYKDKLTLYFTNGATNYYDEELEAKKWNSIREDATMIRSIAEDGTELAINALDKKKYYQEEVVSVLVHFQCGYDGTYTFDFSGIDSFDPSSEICLEDKLINQNNIGERSSMKITEDNHIYSFTASPENEHDRFIIHFFGPSYLPNAVDENGGTDKIKIYSSDNSVYILNNSKQEIKEISVYNMLGQEILSSQVPVQDLNKIDVSAATGYYAVRVLTDKSIYSEKVFIK